LRSNKPATERGGPLGRALGYADTTVAQPPGFEIVLVGPAT